MADFSLEEQLVGKNLATHGYVAGSDEVGRGPWAGPVVTAAVCLQPGNLSPDLLNWLRDSKSLSPQRRYWVTQNLRQIARQTPEIVCYEIIEVPVSHVDRVNILQASLYGMALCLTRLNARRPHKLAGALIDGKHLPKATSQTPLPFKMQAIVKGDQRSYSIAAASILAKCWRDQLMTQWAEIYPNYGWQTNAGYGTKQHQAALALYGVTPLHRRSFKPIQARLAKPAS